MTTNEIEKPAIDKTTWAPGAWQNEPDRKEWRDPLTGLPCLANRNAHYGNWCGYVAVPPGHRLHGADFNGVDISAHGGLTYSSLCDGHVCHVPAPGEPDNVWWFGFDCAHAHDLLPAMTARDVVNGFCLRTETYKTLEYVEAQCARLAEQLAKNAS